MNRLQEKIPKIPVACVTVPLKFLEARAVDKLKHPLGAASEAPAVRGLHGFHQRSASGDGGGHLVRLDH